MLTAIADRAGRSFPLYAHTEGFARWKKGAVSIEQESPTSVVAKVRGQRTRDVVVHDEKGRLLVSCTCPARTFEVPGCKHAWAALLEIDHRGALPNLRGSRAPLLVGFLAPPSDGSTEPSPTAAGVAASADVATADVSATAVADGDSAVLPAKRGRARKRTVPPNAEEAAKAKAV